MVGTCHVNLLVYCFEFSSPLSHAPCGLQGCKNRPTPFPGRMAYKATKPGYFCFISRDVLLLCCLFGPLLCIVSFRWYVFCHLVVLVKFQYLPSDWLERLLWGSLTVARGFPWFILLFHCSVVWLCCSPALHDIHCTSVARYSLFVLKVPLNNNKHKQKHTPIKS